MLNKLMCVIHKMLSWITGHPHRTSNVSSSKIGRHLGTTAVNILEEDIVVDDQNRIQYAWWRIYDHATGGVSYRVLICEELHVPFTETKLDLDLLNWANRVLYSLHLTDCDVVCIFSRCRVSDLSVTQLYGSAIESTNLEEAVAKARDSQDVVRSALEIRYNSRLEKPTIQLWRSIKNQLDSLPQMLCLNGYPDPQLVNGSPPVQKSELLRGLVNGGAQFLFMLQAYPLSREKIIDAQLRQDRKASSYASRQRGVSNTSILSGSDPLLSLSQSWEDDAAIRSTNRARDLANILASAVQSGGWLSSVWLLAEDNNVVATKNMANQAFGSTSMTHPVVVLQHEAEREALAPLLMALRGDVGLAADLERSGTLWNRYTMLLPSSMLGVYWAPFQLTER